MSSGELLVLNSIAPPEIWAKRKQPVDVLKRREEVLAEVFQDGKRKIYKIGPGLAYASDTAQGGACLYVSGCSFFCQYCFVSPESLSGKKGEFHTPREAFEKLVRIIDQTKVPRVEFNGGEAFLTPEWTLELIRLISEYYEQACSLTSRARPGRIWCDTMGFDLMREPQVFTALKPYKKHVVLFISTKGHPDDYELIARTPKAFADEPFLALEQAWANGLTAMPEALDRFFWPTRMDWYIDRLRAIHPNAPRVLHLGKYCPVHTVAWSPDKKMKIIGLRPKKSDTERNAPLREEVIVEWQKRLGALYGPKGARPPYPGITAPIFNVDQYPEESCRLIKRLILNS